MCSSFSSFKFLHTLLPQNILISINLSISFLYKFLQFTDNTNREPYIPGMKRIGLHGPIINFSLLDGLFVFMLKFSFNEFIVSSFDGKQEFSLKGMFI